MRAALPTAALLPLSLVALAAGCGNERQHAPRITGIQEPQRTTRLAYPGQGISFAAPRNWYQSTGKQPLVSVVASGDATVAVWRYRRKEPIPLSTSSRAKRVRSCCATSTLSSTDIEPNSRIF